MADEKAPKDKEPADKSESRAKTASRSRAQAEFDRYKARVASTTRAAAPGFAGPPAFSIGAGAVPGWGGRCRVWRGWLSRLSGLFGHERITVRRRSALCGTRLALRSDFDATTGTAGFVDRTAPIHAPAGRRRRERHSVRRAASTRRRIGRGQLGR